MSRKGRRDSDASLAKIDQPNEIVELIISWLRKKEGILTLSGNHGCGKTYIAQAIYNDWIVSKVNCRFMYVSDFLQDIKSQMDTAGGDCAYRVRVLAETEFFILDDFGASNLTDWQKEIFEQFINERYELMLPTIITTNFTDQELYKFSPRIYSRLKDRRNVYISIFGEDKRQREPEKALDLT